MSRKRNSRVLKTVHNKTENIADDKIEILEEKILVDKSIDPNHHSIIVDVFGGDEMMKKQNAFMHACDVFEKGKQLAKYFQIEVTGDPNLDKLCLNLQDAYTKAGGYILFAAINNIDGIRCNDPKPYIKEGIQTLSIPENGNLGWTLFKDVLGRLGYKAETNQYMMVENISM